MFGFSFLDGFVGLVVGGIRRFFIDRRTSFVRWFDLDWWSRGRHGTGVCSRVFLAEEIVQCQEWFLLVAGSVEAVGSMTMGPDVLSASGAKSATEND